MKNNKEYRQFINEKFTISATNDKCPLFYIFVKSKLVAGIDADQITKDEKLTKLLDFIKKSVYDKLELDDKKTLTSSVVKDVLQKFADKSMKKEKNIEVLKATIDCLFDKIYSQINVFSHYKEVCDLKNDLLGSVEFKEFCDSL